MPNFWMGKSIKLRLAIASSFYLIFARLNKIPERLGEFWRQGLDNQNHIDIHRLSKREAGFVHQQAASYAADDGILVFKMMKILPKN